MESWLMALIIFNAIGLIVTIIVLATLLNEDWPKWAWVAAFIWIIVFIAEGLILRG
jgi:uncharacterized protein (DUF983 family)